MRMVRKQLYLDPRQQAKLRRLAGAWGCTEAEVMRSAIERLPEAPQDQALQMLESAGLLAPIDAALLDQPPRDEEAMLHELEQQARKRGAGLGLTEAVIADRDGR